MYEERLRMLPDVPKDPVSGKKPTNTQLRVMLLLNPIREHPPTHIEAAKILGVSKQAVSGVMCRFKKRCPTYYQRFVEAKRTITTEQTKTGWDEMNHRLLSLDQVEDGLPEFLGVNNQERLSNFLYDHSNEKF